jgi:hypothetical protein
VAWKRVIRNGVGVKTELNRTLVFLLYDADGVCDTSVLHTLRGFRPFVENILVVVNGSLQASSLEAVRAIADDVLERDNVGFDVGAYRDALEFLGWDTLAGVDELFLVNYTFFGPVGSFEPLLDRMDSVDVDLWGITDHPAVSPHPYTGRGTMPEHLQSYWLSIRGPILRSPEFRRYWKSLKDPTSYSEVVTQFECEFTRYFADLGFTWQAAFPAANYGVSNATMEAPVGLLQDGCPLFKKRLYFHDVPALVDQGIVTAAVTEEAKRRGYPEDLIVEGVVRRTTTRELTEGIGASYIRVTDPLEESIQPNVIELQGDRVALRSRTSHPWKTLAERGIDALMGEADILIIAPRPPRPGLRADGIQLRYQNVTEAITADPEFIVGLFDAHSKLGAVYPYVQVVGTAVRGRSWFGSSLLSMKLADQLELTGKFSQTSPVAPYRGAAAYRREVVELLREAIVRGGGWKSLVDLVGDDEVLHQMLDMLTGDIARNGGFFVGETGSLTEAQTSLLFVVDLYSHTPRIFRDYTHYPYSGHVIAPTLKNRIGKAIQNLSPGTFDRVHNLELQARSAISGMRRVEK